MSFPFLTRLRTKRTLVPHLSAEAFVTQRLPDSAVLDVRTPSEYQHGHVAGSLNIDLSGRDFQQRVNTLDKDATYYLYCRSGSRSQMAAGMMLDMGFPHVYNIGGIDDLKLAGVELA